MDKLQQTFKQSYVSSLKKELISNPDECIIKYTKPEFVYDTSMVRFVANVYKPEGLLEKMMSSSNDFEAAISLYKAYQNLSPLLASNEAFWVYLAHVDLFAYVQKRYPLDKELKESLILNRYFFGHSYVRHALAGLWWSVYCSTDETKENQYELTEIFFKNYSFRVVWFQVMLRTKEGLLGILDFLKENPEILENSFESRGLFIAKYFNILGGTKQLSYLKRDYFKQELYKIKDVIMHVRKRQDVQNHDILSLVDAFGNN